MSRSKRKDPRIVVDYERCINVAPGDDRISQPSTRYHCVWCKREGSYNGVLVFEGDDVPYCKEKHEQLWRDQSPDMLRMIPIR